MHGSGICGSRFFQRMQSLRQKSNVLPLQNRKVSVEREGVECGEAKKLFVKTTVRLWVGGWHSRAGPASSTFRIIHFC